MQKLSLHQLLRKIQLLQQNNNKSTSSKSVYNKFVGKLAKGYNLNTDEILF